MKDDICSVCLEPLDPKRAWADKHFDENGRECHEKCCKSCIEAQQVTQRLIVDLGL